MLSGIACDCHRACLDLKGMMGATACGKSTPDNKTLKLAPCATAERDDWWESSCFWPLLSQADENRPKIQALYVLSWFSDTAKSAKNQAWMLLSAFPSAATWLIVQWETNVGVSFWSYCYYANHKAVFFPPFFSWFIPSLTKIILASLQLIQCLDGTNGIEGHGLGHKVRKKLEATGVVMTVYLGNERVATWMPP